ncbi:MAG: alanine racemase [Candidatus Taylorbacteria bacterium]|nr:alanine racemase [Candidatus Taylorbacteria bacterium]
MAENFFSGLRTWIEIDRKAIRHNYGVFRKLISPKTKLMAVVKSNAYGHGLVDFSKEVTALGADYLGVDSMTEARALRREGIVLPILVLGYTMPELFVEASESDISIAVSNFETLDAIKGVKFVKPIKVHIKVDTGLHRQGFMKKDLPKVLSALKVENKILKVEGLFTHFASAKNPSFPKDTQNQIAEFKLWIEAFKKVGFSPLVHASATSGTMLFPDAHFDMVRIGIGMYGLWPAKEVNAFYMNKVELMPVLIWKSIVTEVKKVPKGDRVGYDFTEIFSEDSTIGIIPVGYWHGYSRSLSSIGRVLIKGVECRVLGRVSMDMLIVDVTKVKGCRVSDEVTVLGQGAKSAVSAMGISELSDSSWYELITRINPLIKRFYL